MFKILIFIAAGFLLYKLIMGDRKKKMDQRQEFKEERVEAGEMVKDPVCSTYVSTDSDIRVKEDDQTLYFCSYECRDEYLKRKQED